MKISAATDAGTLLGSDMLPLARAGNSTAYHATMSEIASYASVTAASGTYNNDGRNKLHNALFAVQWRGQGPWNTDLVYTADRWQMHFVSDTMTVQVGAASDAIRAAIGDEAARYYLENTFTGNAAAGAFNLLAQKIEFVQRLSGKTVTVSFWAGASVAGLKLGVNLEQYFGTGGSPSAPVQVAGQSVTTSTTWTRYSLTFSLPSSAGQTFGTNGDDFTVLQFWYSSGTTNATNAGSVGVQSGALSLWGVQLEIGGASTPLEKLDYGLDLVNCQRFYQGLQYGAVGYAPAGGVAVGGFAYYPTVMRAYPTVTISGPVGGDTNVASTNAPDAIGNTSFRFSFQSAAAGDVIATRYAYLSADL